MTTFYLGKDTKGVFKRLIEHIKGLDFDKKWKVSITQYKSTRSLEQNALYWKWVGIIGDELGYTQDELHEVLAENYLEPIFFEFEGETRKRRKSTTKLNVSEFTEYLKHIEIFAAELNIILPKPEDQYYLAMGIKNK